MNSERTGDTIRALRVKKHLTQKQLAALLDVSDKAVSKWETRKGLPDAAMFEPIAKALGVSVGELLSGECTENRNRSANLLRSRFYVCPVCGNVVHAVGEGVFCCCGTVLRPLEPQQPGADHRIEISLSEGDYFVTVHHPMEKDHYLTWIAYITGDQLYMKKLYPEQEAEARFPVCGSGVVCVCCSRHGLFQVRTARVRT